MVRITSLYRLQKFTGERNKIKESLLADIESLAEDIFEDNDLIKFKIEFKLTPLTFNHK
jgi:hypothetical protein